VYFLLDALSTRSLKGNASAHALCHTMARPSVCFDLWDRAGGNGTYRFLREKKWRRLDSNLRGRYRMASPSGSL